VKLYLQRLSGFVCTVLSEKVFINFLWYGIMYASRRRKLGSSIVKKFPY